jgi:hypothetical protein
VRATSLNHGLQFRPLPIRQHTRHQPFHLLPTPPAGTTVRS